MNMPNGTTIQSSHTCKLLLTDLPHQARQAHILPGLVHSSLISVRKLCDNECSVTFTHDRMTVSRNGKDVMYGSRDPKSRLWRVNLKQIMNTKIAQCNHAHDNNNQKDLINYLHAACFSPVKSTWITAIKNGNFSSWLGLNEHSVDNYLSKSTSTTKVHLNQQRQNTRTTKIKKHNYSTRTQIRIMESKHNTFMLQQLMLDKYTQIKQADFPLFQAKGTNTSWYYMIMILMQSWHNPSKIAQHLNY
jgi:hypothetical protein